MNNLSQKRFIGLSLLAALLSVVVIFIGAPLVRVLRNVAGAKRFWIAGIVISGILFAVGLFPIASLILATWLMVRLYTEAEERGWAGITSGLIASLIGTVALMGLPQAFGKLENFDMAENLKTQLKEVIQKMQVPSGTEDSAWSGVMNLNFEMLWGQVPSILFILMMTSLAFALMFDRRTAFMFNLRFEKIASQIRLLEFRLPDWMIWATMVSFLFSFLKIDQGLTQVYALNVFNIMMGLWFFQGLAVLEVTFVAFRVGSMIRLLVYFLIVGQLFFLLSAVGIIDYWVDFRRRIKNFRAPEKDNKNGEHI